MIYIYISTLICTQHSPTKDLHNICEFDVPIGDVMWARGPEIPSDWLWAYTWRFPKNGTPKPGFWMVLDDLGVAPGTHHFLVEWGLWMTFGLVPGNFYKSNGLGMAAAHDVSSLHTEGLVWYCILFVVNFYMIEHLLMGMTPPQWSQIPATFLH